MDDNAQGTPGVVRMLDEVAPVRLPIWLVSQRELRTARSIRVVCEARAQGLAQSDCSARLLAGASRPPSKDLLTAATAAERQDVATVAAVHARPSRPLALRRPVGD
jgi:hypothetical protein